MKTLIVITGPTGVGKTDVAIALAQRLNTEIISADSRQIFRNVPIGTAAPDAEQLAQVKHHFVEELDLHEYFSAAKFEEEALKRLEVIFANNDFAVACGGSMLYVDSLCKGIDNIPTISDEVRDAVVKKYNDEGLNAILEELQELDPEYYELVDKNNHKRVVHAVEICRQCGNSYTSLRKGAVKERPFKIIKIGLNIPREELFDRINRRVDKMIEMGLEDEARALLPLRDLNALNTVGYKEMFAYFDGIMDRTTAIERIKKNTRVYAKKQLTWYARDKEIRWMRPEEALITQLELL